MSTDPEKICEVADWKRLSNLGELRTFLGFAARYAAPIHRWGDGGSRVRERGEVQAQMFCWKEGGQNYWKEHF